LCAQNSTINSKKPRMNSHRPSRRLFLPTVHSPLSENAARPPAFL
jgi:hypothetical protein